MDSRLNVGLLAAAAAAGAAFGYWIALRRPSSGEESFEDILFFPDLAVSGLDCEARFDREKVNWKTLHFLFVFVLCIFLCIFVHFCFPRLPPTYVLVDTGMISCIFPGTDVMIFKIFSPKKIAKKLAFLTQNKVNLCKILIITLVFEKSSNFFAENCQKSQKIVTITSTPGANPTIALHNATGSPARFEKKLL
jgi:hypothetical protein